MCKIVNVSDEILQIGSTQLLKPLHQRHKAVHVEARVLNVHHDDVFIRYIVLDNVRRHLHMILDRTV